MNFIFLGPPGAGKGTLAAKVAVEYGIPHISTGDIFRTAIKNQTPLGVKVKAIIDSGALVSDDLTVELVKDRLSQADVANGFILDGFPRTIPQAEALDKMGIVIDKVVDIDVPDESVVNRMSGRRVCKDCGASYHIENKPSKVEGKCDACNGELYIRKDDAPETVLDRLKVYHEQTEPLKDYYKKCGKLRTVSGTAPIEEITAEILKVLED